MSLSIRPGEKIALCGPSGGGKSSILACIARFYEPQTGTIKVDQVDIRSVPLDDHWGSIALVAQDASLYAGTVRPFPPFASLLCLFRPLTPALPPSTRRSAST